MGPVALLLHVVAMIERLAAPFPELHPSKCNGLLQSFSAGGAREEHVIVAGKRLGLIFRSCGAAAKEPSDFDRV